MPVHAETGDVLGEEVLVLRTPTGACVSYQLAEGEPGRAQVVRDTIHGDSVQFLIPADSGREMPSGRRVEVLPARPFRGQFTGTGLRARIAGQPVALWLPRKTRAFMPDAARALSATACP